MTAAPLGVALGDWVALRARTHPAHLAVEAPDARLTYADLEREVASTAGALRALGVADGEPVAVLAANGARFAVLAHAVPRAGATFMPLNGRLTADEQAWQLADSGARLLLADVAHLETARTVAERSGARLVVAESLSGEPLEAPAEIEPDRPHSVIYTSGTTGRPKGAVLTHGNFYWSAAGSALNLGVDPADRWLACMPLFHVGGLSILLRSAIYGTTAVVHERFDEAAVNRALREERITLLSVVATMLQRLLDVHAEPYPSTLRAVLLGGGPAPRPLLEAAQARGLPVLQTYGLTEAASQVTTLAAADALRKLGSAGLPLTSTTLRIEVDGRAAEPGGAGEILVAGPTVTPGYLGRPEATAEALLGGWLHTGDLGYLDAEGYLYVADRRDDLIVTGGENVYPAEVEAALLAHPVVADCAVVGLPDERWGRRVVAVVVPASGAEPDAAALEAYARALLAGYKVPRRFEFTSTPLPRTASGKLQRHLVRQSLFDGLL